MSKEIKLVVGTIDCSLLLLFNEIVILELVFYCRIEISYHCRRKKTKNSNNEIQKKIFFIKINLRKYHDDINF